MRAATPAVYFVALIVVALMLGPVLYIILGGFRTNSQITTNPAGMPDPWVFTNYIDVLTEGTFWTLMLNSSIVAVATTVGVILMGLMASYVLARYQFRGRGALYALFAAGLMFPITVAITPLYIVVRNLGLINSLAGVILPQIAFALPTTIIILVPFLRAIPDEIQEAAFIDGCSRLGFFWRMVLPLAVPGVITVGILAFIGSWNSYLLPLFLLSDNANFHAAARCAGLLVAVLRRHRESARLHLTVDDPGTGLLQPLRAAHRRRPHRGGQGMSDVRLPPVSERVQSLHAQMTLDEKLGQLVGYWVDQGDELVAPMAGEMATSTKYEDATAHGIGHLTRVYGTRPVDPVERAAWLWNEQRRLRDQTRLGIPAIVHEECLTGLAAWKAATFPTPLAWGASFDPALVEEMGRLIGDSMRAARHPSGARPGARRHPRPPLGARRRVHRRGPLRRRHDRHRLCARACRMPASTPPSSTSSAIRPLKPAATMRPCTWADANSPMCCSRPSRWPSATAARARS